MSVRRGVTRRGFVAAVSVLAVPRRARAQGFAGLGDDANGFAPVVPGRAFAFPQDHGAHTDFRIEWWYVTANLQDASGARFGVQWTLFRQAMVPHDTAQGWDSRQVWMGHAALTSGATHRVTETVSRGGVGTAGVIATPFEAWIDDWRIKNTDGFDAALASPLRMSASGKDFHYDLSLAATQPLVLQGDRGYSRKSGRTGPQSQASYYYSQPFYRAAGRITLDRQTIDVTGVAWLDREWSSQPLAANQTGWDWLSLHLPDGDKLMLYRLRQKDGAPYLSGNWIGCDGTSRELASADIAMTPLATTRIGTRDIPTAWRVAIGSHGVAIETAPLNAQSWMATRFPYWEGPISFSGTHAGVGYLEMTGY